MIEELYKQGKWLNEPLVHEFKKGQISITTQLHTDFWQKTNYGYQTDNGHVLLKTFTMKEFTFYVKATFTGKELYDQCGIMMYQSSEQWVKASLEQGKDKTMMLGSVVTQHGYSDWAISKEIMPMTKMSSIYYRVSRKQDDFLIEISENGHTYKQMRMFHLFDGTGDIALGIYACSPLDSSFTASFSDMKVTPSVWNKESHI